MRRQPILIDLSGRRVVVVGGGNTARRKISSLSESGAEITVVAEQASAELRAMAAANAIELIEQPFAVADLAGSWLVLTCTGNPDVDRRVAAACRARQLWCICCSDGDAGTAALPAVVNTPTAQFAVSGHGDPAPAIVLRDSIALLLRVGALPLARRCAGGGKVILVGTGPGDPDLITLRGLRAIAEADVLVVDRLAPRALWADPMPGVEVIEVGKLPGLHRVSQPEVNRLIVARALAGQIVVRLKGGDPFVLGRGGEEALECIRVGVPVEVVPGVTSAIAVPEAAGIPVTHRGIATAVLIASAHDDLARLAAIQTANSSGVTMVLLMGARQVVEVARSLVAAGRPSDTPMAIIESGWTPGTRTVRSTLAEVAAGAEPATAPAILVIGEVVDLLPELNRLGALASPSPTSGHG